MKETPQLRPPPADGLGMTEVSSRVRTEDLVDRWAHDAKIAGDDEHVKGRSGLRSMAEAWKERNEATPREAAGHTALGVVRELLPEVLDFVAHEGETKAAKFVASHFGAKVATGLAFGVIGNTAVTAYELYQHGWAKAHAKGDNLRQLAQNDAVNVAIAQSLEFHPQFGVREAAERPGVEVNTGKLKALLQSDDAALKPLLQRRADEGFAAAERAWKAVSSVPKERRAEAMMSWYKDNGFEDLRRTDVAFGKGIEYFGWCKAEGAKYGVSVEEESAKVSSRLVPPQTFHRRG